VSTPVRASDRDLCALAAIVSEDRSDLPADGGLPESLLADLMGQIRCDGVDLLGFDTGQQAFWLGQEISATTHDEDLQAAVDQAFWTHYWDSRFCSYPGRTGDLRSAIKITDFYSTRQWHSTGMYADHDRLFGVEHSLMLCLPEAPPGTIAGPERHVRLYLSRGAGPGTADAAAPAPAPGLPRCRASPSPGSPAHPPAEKPAAPGGRRAHQHPDRPAAGHLRGHCAHPPGEHLRTAGRLQPHRRRHPRLSRPRCLKLTATQGRKGQ